MIPSIVFVAVFCLTSFALWLGLQLAKRLPNEHLLSDSRASAQIGIGIVATLSALVLGLMITSAKRSFDEREAEIVRVSASVVLLDRALVGFGDQSAAARKELRALLDRISSLVNPEGYLLEAEFRGPLANLSAVTNLQTTILSLQATNDAERWFQARALEVSSDIARERVLTAERGDRTVPFALLIVVNGWLVLIYMGLGVFSVGNRSVIIAFGLCGLACAAAEFLILEMDAPYSGVIGISSEPLQRAMSAIKQ